MHKFYWGYKNHVLIDCISRLPIYELTTTAEAANSTMALRVLVETHSFLPVTECMWVRNLDSVKKLNTLAHISLLVVATAVITMPESQSYRKLKTIKRLA
jgi:hypothetical protein